MRQMCQRLKVQLVDLVNQVNQPIRCTRCVGCIRCFWSISCFSNLQHWVVWDEMSCINLHDLCWNVLDWVAFALGWVNRKKFCSRGRVVIFKECNRLWVVISKVSFSPSWMRGRTGIKAARGGQERIDSIKTGASSSTTHQGRHCPLSQLIACLW